MTEYSFSVNKFLFLMIMLIATILVDLSVVKIYDLVGKQIISFLNKIIFFGVNTIICLCLQFVIINYLRVTVGAKEVSRLPPVFIFMIVTLSCLSALLIYTIFQMLFYGYYASITLILAVVISYGSASIFLIRLSLLLLSWFRSRRSGMIFLYFVSIGLIFFNLVVTLIYISVSIASRPDLIGEFSGGSIYIFVNRYILLKDLYTISSLVSFIGIWITSALLMKNYGANLVSTVSYWTLLSLPLIYFLANYFFQDLIENTLNYYITNSPITVSIVSTTFLSLSKPIGGLTFGILFWSISRRVGYERNIMAFMVIAGFGIFLIFATNQGFSLILTPFPPFGLATITVLVLGSYLTLIGIFNSATLVKSNSDIRTLIYKRAMDIKLLGLIGHAEFEKEISRTIDKIVKEKAILEKEHERPFDLDEAKLKEHLDMVLKETRKNES